MDKDLKKPDTWWQNYITAAGQIKRELDRRQKAPKPKFIKNLKGKKPASTP